MARQGLSGASAHEAVGWPHGDALATLWPLLGRHIAFHRRLVDLTDSVKAALLLSQAIYWTRHGRDIDRSGGWFAKTALQWQMETGLTEREQGGVRAILRSRELLMEQRRGIPARLYFRVCRERLIEALAVHLETAPSGADQSLLSYLLGPPLAYHRTLATLTQGVHSGLLLSRALHLTRQSPTGGASGWIARTTRQWTDDLGLSRREQEHARRVLTALGIWDEALVGMPPRLVVRVRLDGLAAMLVSADARGAKARRPETNGDDLADSLARNVDTAVADCGGLESTKAPSQCRQHRPHGSHNSAHPQVVRSTSDLLQPPHAAERPVGLAAGPRGGDLVFPQSLQPEECDAAHILLRRVGPQAQAILDELAARIQANAVRSTPVAYLRGLVKRAAAGMFVPEAGLPIAIARRRRELEDRERETSRRLDRAALEDRARPEFQLKIAERRAQMQQWLQRARRDREGGAS